MVFNHLRKPCLRRAVKRVVEDLLGTVTDPEVSVGKRGGALHKGGAATQRKVPTQEERACAWCWASEAAGHALCCGAGCKLPEPGASKWLPSSQQCYLLVTQGKGGWGR